MADGTNIEWTDATWSPIRARNTATGKVGWHCHKVSAGCDNCYAASFNARLGNQVPFKPGHLSNGDVELFLDEKMLTQPLRWKKPRMIFVCSMTDLFADFVPDEWIDQLFAVMALAPQHTFQILTKRPARMRRYFEIMSGEDVLSRADRQGRLLRAVREMAPLPNPFTLQIAEPIVHEGVDRQMLVERWHFQNIADHARAWPLPNVWLGTSIEDQRTAEERIPHLLATPAAVHFVSAEPLLGPVDLTLDGLVCLPCERASEGIHMDPSTGAYECCPRCDWTGIGDEWGIDWVIVGGESGPGARPMHPVWARDLRDQCREACVPFFMKQMGGVRKPFATIPDDLDVKQWPESRPTPEGGE